MNVLLTPARIGGVEMRNRIVMPPMTTRLADPEGYVTDEAIAYYMARVHGGVGLLTVEMASPQKSGRHRLRELGIYDDRFLPGLTRLVTAIHGGGAKTAGGRRGRACRYYGHVRHLRTKVVPRQKYTRKARGLTRPIVGDALETRGIVDAKAPSCYKRAHIHFRD